MGENPFFLICFYHFKIETEKQMKRRYHKVIHVPRSSNV